MVARLAKTVDEYLASLPEDRRTVIAAVRKVILNNLPKGYEENINYGMICYQVPLARYPNTYNKQPLCYASIAAQKNHYAVYLLCDSLDSREVVALREGFESAGKKLDMGKSCLRFKKLEGLPLDVIGKFVASIPLEKRIEMYEQSRRTK